MVGRKIKSHFKNLTLNKKIILSYSITFFLIAIISISSIYIGLKRIMKNNIEIQLSNTSNIIKEMIVAITNTSIQNYLRSNSDVGIEYANYYYNEFKKGHLTEKEAKQKVFDSIKNIKIGKTGYIYIVNSNGKLIYHPFDELKNQNIIEYNFVKNQVKRKEGYLEYLWQNPNNINKKPKALYMEYFEKWDWIISSSSYKNEFFDLISINDFNEQLKNIKFGKTGYITVLNENGDFLIHPSYKGHNFIKENNDLAYIIEKLLKNKNGMTEYEWKNKDENFLRKKIMIYSYIPEYKWIVASTAYKSDFYNVINKIIIILSLGFIIVLTILNFFLYKISQYFTNPIKVLEETIVKSKEGNLSIRASIHSNDEIGMLSKHFNSFLDTLEKNNQKLKKEIELRKKATTELEHNNINLEKIVMERTKELKDTQKEILKSEKLLALNKLIKSIAHNINTPLGNSITTTKYFKKYIEKTKMKFYKNELKKADLEKMFNVYDSSYGLLENGLSNVSNLINSFKYLSSTNENIVLKKISINYLIKNLIDKISIDNIRFQCNFDKEIYLNTYPNILELVINNIISNSIIHGFDPGSFGLININTKNYDNNIIIKITDNGKGIAKEDLGKVFDPFYTANNQIDSKGLGLTIVYNYVHDILNGKVIISSNLNEGTQVKITLPKH